MPMGPEPLAGLLEPAVAGRLPWVALVPVVVADLPGGKRLRTWLEITARRRLARGEQDARLLVSLGLVDAEAADPKGWTVGASRVRRFRDLPDPRSAPKRDLDTQKPALFDALLAEATRGLAGGPGAAEPWLDLAFEALEWLRTAGLPRPVLWERELRFLAHRANLHRERGEHEKAARIFAELDGDPRRGRVVSLAVHAELWRLEGALRRALGEATVAERLLRWAGCAYRALRERGLARDLAGGPAAIDSAPAPEQSRALPGRRLGALRLSLGDTP
jgi:hypothetical protein